MASRIPQTLEERINGWIVSDDTGISSETIWAVMMGVEPADHSVPLDLADFGRCYRLLELIPEWKGRLDEVVAKYPTWKPIVANWAILIEGYKTPRSGGYIIDDLIK